MKEPDSCALEKVQARKRKMKEKWGQIREIPRTK